GRDARTVGTRGIGVPRRRLSPLGSVLRVGAVLALPAALLVGSLAGAVAQSSSALFSPDLGGKPQRFQQSGNTARDARAAVQSISTFKPAPGAGTTGFDSSGKRKAKGKGKGKDKGKDQSSEKGKAPALPSPPSAYGSPQANPLAPTRLAVPRLPIGVARRGAS